ncbi:MAG: invasion associated locus B family protein [Afipia sp.]
MDGSGRYGIGGWQCATSTSLDVALRKRWQKGGAPLRDRAKSLHYKTGQLVASVNVKLPPDTRQPVLMIQLPVGLFLPAGVNFQIDEGKSQALVLQTCDLKGCYAATTVSPELLGSMKSGKRLSVVFQNLNKENVNFAFVLSGFAEGYDKIN